MNRCLALAIAVTEKLNLVNKRVTEIFLVKLVVWKSFRREYIFKSGIFTRNSSCMACFPNLLVFFCPLFFLDDCWMSRLLLILNYFCINSSIPETLLLQLVVRMSYLRMITECIPILLIFQSCIKLWTWLLNRPCHFLNIFSIYRYIQLTWPL